MNQTETNTKGFFDILSNISEIPKKFISNFVNLIMSGNKKRLKLQIEEKAAQVMSLREEMMDLKDSQLRDKKEEFQKRIAKGENLDSILIEAFAVAREAARRVLGEEHYKVQIMGGIALHMGMIAEMKTGEGKTLVGVLPAYLNALLGRGVHIVTVNDYLARRDSKWMGRVFRFLGMTVGCITSDGSRSATQKRKEYACDIIYCTNSELGFDYLRDNMATSLEECVQRDFYYCIIDEADNVMIDDAKTPLIISGATDITSETYIICDQIVKSLSPEDYEIDKKEMQANFTDSGLEHCLEKFRTIGQLEASEELYSPKNSVLLHQLSQALRANHLYRLGIEYIVERDDEEMYGESAKYNSVKIVDENTGRTMEGRRYSDGLHQALEAKEGVYIRPESETIASVTYQRLFRLFEKKSGMTGTAESESEEFESTYGIKCIAIETNRPKQRLDLDDLMYITKEAKIRGMIEIVRECNANGQPIIIGTPSVESSEEVAYYLEKTGFELNLLNAKNHEKEAEIIANAGRYGAITVVTNMAGRGTDIKLGGDWRILSAKMMEGIEDEEEKIKIEEEIKFETEQNKKLVIEVGGIFILGFERNEIGDRPENQLRGRSGRQGDPGVSRFLVSAEDQIIKKFNPNMSALLRRFGASDDDVLDHKWLTSAISNAQERIKLYHQQMRQSMQKYSDIKEANMVRFYNLRRSVLAKTDLISYVAGEFERLLTEGKLNDMGMEIVQLKLDFYGKLKMLSQKGANKALKQVRAIILENFDSAWRRYLLLMNNAKDIVAFQRYTDKDPLISYYNIAQNRFSEIMYDAMLGYIKDLISMKVEMEDDRLSEINFEMLRDYLFETREKRKDLDLFLEENTASEDDSTDEEDSADEDELESDSKKDSTEEDEPISNPEEESTSK